MKDGYIVVIGSSNTDMIVKTSHIPRPGETVLGGRFSTAAGGKGANQAVSAARAGGKVVFLARVGEDLFGRQAVEGFRKDGINVDYIVVDKETPSGVALIFVDEKGENSIAVAPGANANLSPMDIESARDVITSASCVLMQLEIPLETVKTAAEIAASNDVPVILNPAPARRLDDALLGLISLITPNETEAEMLSGVPITSASEAEKAADVLHDLGVKTVIITRGLHGVYVSAPEFRGALPGFVVKAVDSTAAGDVFNGVLAAVLAERMTLMDAVGFAQAAAALSVTKLGAQTSAPHRKEIEAFLRQQS